MRRIRNWLLITLIVALALPTNMTAALDETPDSVTASPDGSISSNTDTSTSPSDPPSSSDTVGDASPPSTTDTSPPQPDTSPAAPPSDSQSPAPPSTATNQRLLITKIHLDEPEIIELFNPDTTAVDLAGVRVEFIPNNGKPLVILHEFTSGSVPAGGFITIGDETPYPFSNTKNALLLSGAVRVVLSESEDEVKFGDTIINTQKKDERFIQRCHHTTAEFIVTSFDIDRLGVWPNCQSDPEPLPTNLCSDLRLSEIGAYIQPQFIELMNGGNEPIQLEGCKLAVGRAPARYVFPSGILNPGEIIAISATDTSLKLPKTSGTVHILNTDDEEVDTISYEKLAKDTSWALLDGEWQQTYKPTAGAANIYQQWRDCEPGKRINELTGNCVKIPASIDDPASCAPGYYRHPETGRCRKEGGASGASAKKTPAPCKEGQYRSEATGRCRSIAAAAAKTLKPCKEGYFRSPETGRCRKIAADKDVLKECAEGYERNPTTKRCRKIRATTAPDVGFAPQSAQEIAGSTLGWWVLGGASILAVGIGAWYYRWEIAQAARRIKQTFTVGKK